jgi:hypothetical protein
VDFTFANKERASTLSSPPRIENYTTQPLLASLVSGITTRSKGNFPPSAPDEERKKKGKKKEKRTEKGKRGHKNERTTTYLLQSLDTSPIDSFLKIKTGQN